MTEQAGAKLYSTVNGQNMESKANTKHGEMNFKSHKNQNKRNLS